MPIDWGGVPEWLGLVGAVVAFRVGIDQYRTGQDWQRAQFVAAEAQKFFQDPQIAAALLLIDYNVIRLNARGERVSAGGAVFTDQLLVNALAVHTKFTNEVEVFRPDELQARTAFDALLTGLEQFDHYIATDLITIDDVKVHFHYWIPKLGDPASKWKEPAFYTALHAFVLAYEYTGVQHLFKEFGIKIGV